MRVLVTNDDGVHAPGLQTLARHLARWAAADPDDRQVVVVAPLANQSGASAAVGTVYERESVAYERVAVEGAPDLAAFGIDGSPALTVILGCRGAFGPPPDLVVSGINHGVNVGRSVLHSGTVGAALTAAQLGARGLAVSLRSAPEPLHWDTAATLAVAVVDGLETAPPGTVLNLNVPSVPLGELKGTRRGHIGRAGLIRGAEVPGDGPVASGRGEVRLRLGAAVPQLGDTSDEDPDEDAALIAAGFASLTPVLGVREDHGAEAEQLVGAALDRLAETAGAG